MKNAPKAKIVSRKVIHKGWHSIETITVQPQSLKHSDYAAPMTRELNLYGTVAVALLYTPETDELLFAEQFRIGAFMAGDQNPYLIECSAGFMDEGETPEEAVRREAKEETGCDIIDLEFIGKAYPSPGGSTEVFMLYCGRIGKAKTGLHGLEDEGEEIKTHIFPATEAIRMLDAGEITNGATIICMHWFARHHDRLRKKWGKK